MLFSLLSVVLLQVDRDEPLVVHSATQNSWRLTFSSRPPTSEWSGSYFTPYEVEVVGPKPAKPLHPWCTAPRADGRDGHFGFGLFPVPETNRFAMAVYGWEPTTEQRTLEVTCKLPIPAEGVFTASLPIVVHSRPRFAIKKATSVQCPSKAAGSRDTQCIELQTQSVRPPGFEFSSAFQCDYRPDLSGVPFGEFKEDLFSRFGQTVVFDLRSLDPSTGRLVSPVRPSPFGKSFLRCESWASGGARQHETFEALLNQPTSLASVTLTAVGERGVARDGCGSCDAPDQGGYWGKAKVRVTGTTEVYVTCAPTKHATPLAGLRLFGSRPASNEEVELELYSSFAVRGQTPASALQLERPAGSLDLRCSAYSLPDFTKASSLEATVEFR